VADTRTVIARHTGDATLADQCAQVVRMLLERGR
jgi:hypothetical protein